MQKRCGNKLDRCRATLISRLGAGCQHEFESPGGHTHPPNLLKNDCLRYRQSLKRRSKETNEAPSVTISVCATSVPKEVNLLIKQMLLSSYYFNSFTQVQTMLSKPAQRKICQRSRECKKTYPEVPVTPEDYANIDERYSKTLDGQPFLVGHKNVEGGVILMFSTAGKLF